MFLVYSGVFILLSILLQYGSLYFYICHNLGHSIDRLVLLLIIMESYSNSPIYPGWNIYLC